MLSSSLELSSLSLLNQRLDPLVGFILIVLLLVVTYSAGSGVPLVIPGYDGTENVPFWLKITDMFLYSTYIMMAVLVLLIVGFGIAKKFK